MKAELVATQEAAAEQESSTKAETEVADQTRLDKLRFELGLNDQQTEQQRQTDGDAAAVMRKAIGRR